MAIDATSTRKRHRYTTEVAEIQAEREQSARLLFMTPGQCAASVGLFVEAMPAREASPWQPAVHATDNLFSDSCKSPSGSTLSAWISKPCASQNVLAGRVVDVTNSDHALPTKMRLSVPLSSLLMTQREYSSGSSLPDTGGNGGLGTISILIDGYNLGLEHGTGVATYGRNLCRMIGSLGGTTGLLYDFFSDPAETQLLGEIAFFDPRKKRKSGMFAAARRLRDAILAPLGCKVDRIQISGKVIFDALRSRIPDVDAIWNSPDVFHRCLRSFRWFGRFGGVKIPDLDIAHWTYPLPIRNRGVPNVYTLHDLVPLRLPYTTLDNKRRYFKLCKRLVGTADHIITVSENSRKDIINLLGADPDKVTNTYQPVGFPENLLGKSESAVRNELSGTFNLDYKGYFLFYGAVEPKKNLGRLIEAYLGSATGTPLIIIGAPGWNSKEELRLLEMLRTLGCKNRIMRLDYLPLSLLMTLIRGAKATLFPSLYEGFGLPLAESMLLGTAVLTSNVSSLPEVGGGAACFVDPYDTRSMAEAIRELDVNDALRLELEAKGRIRAEYFSTAACARRLNEVYGRVLERRVPRSAKPSSRLNRVR